MEKFSVPEFPNSFAEPFEVTSSSSGEYNCIAWALNDQARLSGHYASEVSIGQKGCQWKRASRHLLGYFSGMVINFAKMVAKSLDT